MALKCYFEPVTVILRVGSETDRFGAPFEFVVTALIDGKVAYLKGARGVFTRETFKVVKKTLQDHGIEDVRWEKTNNKLRSRELDIS